MGVQNAGVKLRLSSPLVWIGLTFGLSAGAALHVYDLASAPGPVNRNHVAGAVIMPALVLFTAALWAFTTWSGRANRAGFGLAMATLYGCTVATGWSSTTAAYVAHGDSRLFSQLAALILWGGIGGFLLMLYPGGRLRSITLRLVAEPAANRISSADADPA